VVVGLAIVAALTAQHLTRAPLWGLVATALIAVGAALAAQPLLRLLSASLMRALLGVAGPSARFARGSFAANNSRAVLTAAMVGIGIGGIIWVRMLAYSFETSLVHALSGAMQGDWVISSAHIAQGFLEAPVDERLIGDVQALNGVAEAVGERLVDWQYADGPVAIDAFDARYFTTAAFGAWPLVGSALPDVWQAVSAGTAVLVSGNLGLRAGDTLRLQTPSGVFSAQVGGLTIDFGSPRGTIVMARERYRRDWNDAQVNRVFVRVAAGRNAAAVRTALAQQLGDTYGLRIISAHDLLAYFATQVRRAFAPVDVLAALMLVVLLVGLADTLAASVLERTRELATIRTLGVRRAALRRAVVVEGLGLGVPGLLLAVGLGLGLGNVWVRQTFPFLIGWPLEVYVPVAQIGLVCVATLVVCAVAALIPARRAAALQLAAALRCE
jgi:putative ABC transport system permease protein